jgi:hypothetical protein
MKKTLKSQLIAAVAMLVIAAVALTGATYAWFTSIANPDVESIDLYVKAADAIMLSALATPEINNVEDWKINLLKTEITDADRGNQTNAFPTNMLNVSSLFNGTNSNFYTATHTNQGILNGYALTDQPNNFAKFSLWAKSTRNGFLYLDAGSLLQAIAQTAPGNGIANTVRIGIVPVDYDADGVGGDDAVVGEDFANAIIWEPNSKAHLSTTYGGPGGTSKIAYDAATGLTVDDVDAAATFDFVAGDTNVNANGTYVSTGGTSAAKIALFNMKMETMQKFNVYIWVEGADDDTVNAVAKNSFSTYLKFGQQYDNFVGTYALS